MNRVLCVLALLVAGAVGSASVVAQEGHPVRGSWIGTWDVDGESARLLLVMDWDGDNIIGTINPGRDNMPIRRAIMDYENWTLRLEAAAADGTAYVLEGQLDGLAFHNRELSGTWRTRTGQGTFRIARQ